MGEKLQEQEGIMGTFSQEYSFTVILRYVHAPFMLAFLYPAPGVSEDLQRGSGVSTPAVESSSQPPIKLLKRAIQPGLPPPTTVPGTSTVSNSSTLQKVLHKKN